MKTIIRSTSQPAMVELRFSEAPVMHEFTGDVIADVNKKGNWIRGLELLGSGMRFSLQQVLSSFSRGSQPQNDLTATYDEDADAGFLYLPYASPNSVERDHRSDPSLLKSSHSVEDEKALFGLDADKTLVFIRFMIPPTERLEDFIQLFRT